MGPCINRRRRICRRACRKVVLRTDTDHEALEKLDTVVRSMINVAGRDITIYRYMITMQNT